MVSPASCIFLWLTMIKAVSRGDCAVCMRHQLFHYVIARDEAIMLILTIAWLKCSDVQMRDPEHNSLIPTIQNLDPQACMGWALAGMPIIHCMFMS